MKKILLAAFVAVFSCAAFGQTVVVGANMPPYPTCTGTNVPCAIGFTGKTANVTAALLYTVATTGLYVVRMYGVETVRDAVSSTLPNIQTVFTDADTSFSQAVSTAGNNAGNTVGAFVQGQTMFRAKAGTNINYQTANYASNSANTMTYSFYVEIERLQ